MECTSFNWGSIFRSLGKLLASDRLPASQLEQQKLRYIDYSISEGKALVRGKKILALAAMTSSKTTPLHTKVISLWH